jgi:FAD/FMN-containing dehydrogenase
MIAFVMFFSQARTDEVDRRMQEMTKELVDAALHGGGRYYLPYRLHATAEQFRRAYPQSEEFFKLKRQYDPQEVFQNQFYLKYANQNSAQMSGLGRAR